MSSVSFQMMSVAMGWQIYSLTHSAFALGLVGLAQFVPMFVLTLVVGHVADRYDRRTIVFICQASKASLRSCCVSGVAWMAKRRPIYAWRITGAARAFESPSMAALLPSLVPRTQCSTRPPGLRRLTRPRRFSGPRWAGCFTASARRGV